MKKYFHSLLLCFLLIAVSVLLPQSVLAVEPGIVSGTGQFVTQANGVNASNQITAAATQALNRYKANGGTTPKIVIIFENVNDPNSVNPALRSVFGTSVPIVGMNISWVDYVPISLDQFPPGESDRSVVVMALGGSAVTITTGTGTADFNSTSPTVLAAAGTQLAHSLTPNPSKKNLILLFGPMHTPINESVISGMKSVWGNPLPQHIKIMGWGAPYWAGGIYMNNSVTAGSSTVMGVMITGDYQWSFSGIFHDASWGDSNNAVTEITRQTQLVNTAVGGQANTVFMVPGHPDRPLFPSIRNSVASVLPTNASLLGMHAGSETGHDTTAGDVIPDASHFFVAALAPLGAGVTPSQAASPTRTPSPSPVACIGDINNDRVVDLSDYSLLVKNFFKSPLIDVKADLNGDGVDDLSDYSILASHFLKPCL